MGCRIADLRNKQVVCIKTGGLIGYVYDVDFNTADGTLTAIIIPGRPRLFGILGHEEDIVIPWSQIEVIGHETILVAYDCTAITEKNKRKFFFN